MRFALYFASFVLMADSLVLARRKSYTLGLAILIVLSVSLFLLAKFRRALGIFTSGFSGMVLKYTLGRGVCAFVCLACFILAYGRNTADYTESAVIVPGSGVKRDGTPSSTAIYRLEKCLEYCRKNPKAVVVVSGGKTAASEISEGMAMKNYLTKHGLDPDRILCDEQAGNTRQNFTAAKKLLSDAGISEKTVLITNSFHAFRAASYAARAGFDDIAVLTAPTDLFTFIPAVLREVCAAAAMMFLNY